LPSFVFCWGGFASFFCKQQQQQEQQGKASKKVAKKWQKAAKKKRERKEETTKKLKSCPFFRDAKNAQKDFLETEFVCWKRQTNKQTNKISTRWDFGEAKKEAFLLFFLLVFFSKSRSFCARSSRRKEAKGRSKKQTTKTLFLHSSRSKKTKQR